MKRRKPSAASVLSVVLAVFLVIFGTLSVSCEKGEEPAQTTGVEEPAQTAGAEEPAPSEQSGEPEAGTPGNEAGDSPADGGDYLLLPDEQLNDRLLGGWVGSMIGVTWGASTEFGWCGTIIPEENMPNWTPSMINGAFGQDDLYVEIPFMDAMAEKGVLCGVDDMAEKFRTSAFPLWHANMQGRKNLQNGLLPPDSGSYAYNVHADDIDWQIECDFLGLMYPTLVNACAARSFEVGHVMNYGDGVYGGVFIAAMHAAAYYASSVEEVVEAGLSVIPENTKFRALIEDVITSYKNGDTWEENWRMLEDKWAWDDKCPEGQAGALNIDAKLNSGYVVIGLLYGEGDLAETVKISTRCGQDSDCNPSSAASILGGMLGLSGIDEIYTKALDWDGAKFSNTNYTFRSVAELSLSQAREVLLLSGAELTDGVWRIPKDGAAVPVPWEQWPDGISATLEAAGGSNRCVSVSLNVFEFGEEADSVRLDMGDGFVCDTPPVVYTYAEPGEYTISCEVRGNAGSVLNLERKVTVFETDLIPGRAVSTVMTPKGGGNADPEVMRDGVVPQVGSSDSALQYDTYDGGGAKSFIYAGIRFDIEATLSGVRFTEGRHFWDGGWFSGEPYAEVYVDGSWRKVSASIDRPYPGNSEAEQGPSFETYTFTFDEPVRCAGVRIAGKPGGSAYFISVGEIEPVAVELHGETSSKKTDDLIIICSVSSPAGGGAKDIRVITDGVKPDAAKASDPMQYDTYHGVTPGEEAYVGFLYRTPREVTEIAFTEGNHFWDGGWWKGGAPAVEVCVDGAWKRVGASASPAYPEADSVERFGKGYETYVFTLDEPVLCGGVRLIGTAGGAHGFISISELEVR